MIGAYTWQQTGLNLMLFLVGLQGLPPPRAVIARTSVAGESSKQEWCTTSTFTYASDGYCPDDCREESEGRARDVKMMGCCYEV